MSSVSRTCRLALAVSAFGHAAVAWQCYSDEQLGPVRSATSKGINIDDWTFRWCASRIPATWPNADDSSVSYIRLFKAWDPSWEPDGRELAWVRLKAYVIFSGAKVLIGTPVSCSREDDDLYWSWTRDLMRFLGPEHILGLAVGNELELLQFKGGEISSQCVEDIWERGYLWQRFTDVVTDVDTLPGFEGLPVTSVFTGFALWGRDSPPFREEPGRARVNSFIGNATRAYGLRFAFTWNIYPYWNSGLSPSSLDYALCWNRQDCFVPARLRAARAKQQRMTGRTGHTMWIGETGWSFPRAASLQNANKNRDEWSSRQTFERAYQEFLAWDQRIDRESDSEVPGPDVSFWFTVRDSLQFGNAEHFGLIDTCSAPECKLHGDGFHVATYETVNGSEGMVCSPEGVENEGVLFGNFSINFKDCQDLCTQNPDCQYFSFWASSNWCQHTANCCLVREANGTSASYKRNGTTGELCPPPEPDAGIRASPFLVLVALALVVSRAAMTR